MLRSLSHALQRPNVLASGAAVVLFCAVSAYWAWVFHSRTPDAQPHLAPPASIDGAAGATLFGAQPERGRNDAVQLLGILSFDAKHGAAIVSVGGEAARVVQVSGEIADATTLSEIRTHSIVIDRHGIQREITLPAAQNPSAFVR